MINIVTRAALRWLVIIKTSIVSLVWTGLFSLLCRISGISPPHLLWPDWPTSPPPWTTSAGACQTAASWPTSPTATWWICRGRRLRVHPPPLPPPRPQRGGSPRASRFRPRAQAQARPPARLLARLQPRLQAQGASSAPSPAWWRALRWPRTSLPLHTPRQPRQLLKGPQQEAVSHRNLSYASPRSCWSSMISTQTGECFTFCCMSSRVIQIPLLLFEHWSDWFVSKKQIMKWTVSYLLSTVSVPKLFQFI